MNVKSEAKPGERLVGSPAFSYLNLQFRRFAISAIFFGVCRFPEVK